MSDTYVGLMLPKNDPIFVKIKNPHITLAYFADTNPHELARVIEDNAQLFPVDIKITGTLLWANRTESGEPLWISAYTAEDALGHYRLDSLRRVVCRAASEEGYYKDNTYRFTPHITKFTSTSPVEVVNKGVSIIEPGLVYTIKHLTVKEVGGPYRLDLPMDGSR